MKKLVIILSLVAFNLNAQCTDCNISSVTVKFNSAIKESSDSISKTISGDFKYILDFKNNTCEYYNGSKLLSSFKITAYGILKKHKEYYIGLKDTNGNVNFIELNIPDRSFIYLEDHAKTYAVDELISVSK